MNENSLQKCFMLFLQIMPDAELVSFAQFIAKIEEKEHDQAFRKLIDDFITDNHEHEAECINASKCNCSYEHEAKLAITLFRELLK
jgi:hypothetical protein